MISRIGFYFLLVGLFARNSQGTLYDADDALILEVDGLSDEPDLTAEELTTSNPEDAERVSEDGSCTTSAGQRGTCMKSRDCFPYLYNLDVEGYGSTLGFARGVRNLVKNVTESCSLPEGTTLPAGDAQAQPGDALVCCVTFSRAIQENRKYPKWPGDKVFKSSEAETKISQCGNSIIPTSPLIVGGRDASPGEFPWTVALILRGGHTCGGSLIDSRTVLTAAHCVNSLRSSALLKHTSYYIGDHNLYVATEVKHEVRKAQRLVFHKKFDGSHLRDDVALIILDKPVTFTDRIEPVCLHTGTPPYDGGKVRADVAGWGKIYDGGPLAQTLRTVNIGIWTNAQCSAKYRESPRAPPVSPNMLCAGSTHKDKDTLDTCQGDSGGPLTININGKGTQVGIVSWGVGCGSYPGVFTRVDKYLSWINKYRAQ